MHDGWTLIVIGSPFLKTYTGVYQQIFKLHAPYMKTLKLLIFAVIYLDELFTYNYQGIGTDLSELFRYLGSC